MNILNNLIRLVLLSLLLAGCVNPLKKAANTRASLPEADSHGFHDYDAYQQLIFKK